jgi:ABC-type glycerol-3-phosphate transport system substrate-binding protein
MVFCCLALAAAGVLFASGGAEGAAAKAEPVTIEIWNVFDPATNVDGISHQEKHKEYMAEHPQVTIKWNTMVYADLKQKYIVAGQAQQGPQVMHMLGEWIPEFTMMGILEDITPNVKAWTEADKFPQSIWNVATAGGKIYGVPSTASTRVLLYRDDLFKKAGVPKVPTTWTELREAAKKLTQDTNGDGKTDVYGFAFCSSSKAIRGAQEFAIHLWSTGADLAKKEGDRWVPGFTVEQAREVFQVYFDLMFTDKVAPEFSLGWEYTELDPAFQAGTVAMVQDGAWMKRRSTQAETGKDWKTAPYPYARVPATYLEVKVEGISKFARFKKEAWDFIKWMYGRDNMVYITRTGNLPPRTDSKESKFWEPDVYWRDMFFNTVSNGRPMPAVPMAAILKGSMEDVQEVLYKRMTPEAAARDFFNRVKESLDATVNKK